MKGLNELLKEHQPPDELSAEVVYRSNFKLELTYWPDSVLQKNIQKSKASTWTRGHQKVEEVKEEVFRNRLASAVKGWSGCTCQVLAEMGVMDLGSLYAAERKEAEVAGKEFTKADKKALAETEMPFSRDNLLLLMEKDSVLERFLLDEVCNPDNFPLMEERGN